jgi:iron complex outermembrane receptor protein
MANIRALSFGLLASTAMTGPVLAQPAQSPTPGTNATDVTSPPPKVQAVQSGQVPDQTEIVITATKREERLQNVPQSVIALGTRRLDQLNI